MKLKVKQIEEILPVLNAVIMNVRGLDKAQKKALIHNENIISEKYKEVTSSEQRNTLTNLIDGVNNNPSKSREKYGVTIKDKAEKFIQENPSKFNIYNKDNQQRLSRKFNAAFPDGVIVPPSLKSKWDKVLEDVQKLYPDVLKENKTIEAMYEKWNNTELELDIQRVSINELTTNEYKKLEFMLI